MSLAIVERGVCKDKPFNWSQVARQRRTAGASTSRSQPRGMNHAAQRW